EETGLIVPIGDHVLRMACLQMKKWLDEGLDVQQVSVNVSSKQFQKPSFVDDLRLILLEAGLPPNRLELEITERTFMHNVDMAIQRLHDIKQMGISLSIDDFGTGYSSLSYLN